MSIIAKPAPFNPYDYSLASIFCSVSVVINKTIGKLAALFRLVCIATRSVGAKILCYTISIIIVQGPCRCVTLKLINSIFCIAAGSYILVGYELLNNDFRHVKSLFHFVLPPIKSLRVSPEGKALAAWSRSNINIFYVTLHKKITIQAIHFKKDYSTVRLLVNSFP